VSEWSPLRRRLNHSVAAGIGIPLFLLSLTRMDWRLSLVVLGGATAAFALEQAIYWFTGR
jgi:hypothetical protein